MTETDITQPCAAEKGNICIECGLCCDGSMFRHVGIDQNDDLTLLKQMGVESLMVRDKLIFLLPCLGQEAKRCKLYNDARRFKVCKEFKCKLLKQYLAGALSYDAAMDVIAKVMRRRQSVREFATMLHADRAQSIFSFLRELDLSGKLNDLSFRKKHSKQILDCFAFKELLKKRFYDKSGQAPCRQA